MMVTSDNCVDLLFGSSPDVLLSLSMENFEEVLDVVKNPVTLSVPATNIVTVQYQ